jgi:hypothetical protein
MRVDLPIFWNNKDNQILDDLGIETEVDFKECEVRIVTFYVINLIYKFNNEDEYTVVMSNGESFVCELNKTEVEKLIKL